MSPCAGIDPLQTSEVILDISHDAGNKISLCIKVPFTSGYGRFLAAPPDPDRHRRFDSSLSGIKHVNALTCFAVLIFERGYHALRADLVCHCEVETIMKRTWGIHGESSVPGPRSRV